MSRIVSRPTGLCCATALTTLLLASPAIAGSTGALASAARAAGLEVGAAVDANLSVARLDLAATEFTSATP